MSAGVTLDFSKAQSLQQPQQPTQRTGPPFQPTQQTPTLDFSKAQMLPQDQSGLAKGDTGFTVITPKDDESFQDTLNRAVNRWKSLSPDQQQSELGLAQKGRAKKVGQSLGGAAAMGVAGPTTLASLAYFGQAAAPTAVAVTGYAASHPIQAAIAIHIGRSLGIPIPKVLDVLSKFGGE